MLDLETLSIATNPAIIQIAALAFDPLTGETGARFNAYVRNPSGHIDAQTVAWWMQQAHAPKIGAAMARKPAPADAWASPVGATLDELKALREFGEWLWGVEERLGCEYDCAVDALWSHGATFDIVHLASTYTRNGLDKPWSYKIELDTRTLYAFAPGGMPAVELDESRQHDAAYDCERQVKQVVGALAAMRKQFGQALAYREMFGDAEICGRVDANADTQRSTAAGWGPSADVDEDGADCRNYAEPAPAKPAPFDPPPVWSNAEARCEGEANPVAHVVCDGVSEAVPYDYLDAIVDRASRS